MTEEYNEEPLSKTQIKKQMNDLQDLGADLVKLSKDLLKKMDLPEELLTAVLECKKINSNGALKRQVQYIGRLMRNIDPEPISTFLARLNGEDTAYNAFLHRVERWRERLLEEDKALNDFITEFPHADIPLIRALIRNTHKEKEQNKPPKSFRALYQIVKLTMQEQDAPDQLTD